MKNQIIVFSILLLFFSCNEKPQEKQSDVSFTEKSQVKNGEEKSDSLIFDYTNSDTLFIQKDNLLGTAQSIFLEKNKDSKLYERILFFDIDELYNGAYTYNHSMEYCKENNIEFELTKRLPIIESTKWVILKKYKNVFCAYRPCDFYFYYKASFNDTTFIDWTGEGPIANKIINQKKIDDKTYYFQLRGSLKQNRELKIHIIDKEKGIAIFEEIINKTDKSYHLMIDADKIKSVPLIVNNCKINKQKELRFDEIDYEELLKDKLIKNDKIPNKNIQ